TEGRAAARRMRRVGKTPGVVYGGTAVPQPIELDHNALFHALRNEVFHSSILSMKVDDAVTRVLLRDVQMHPFRDEILHVDFQRVDESKKIHMKVPLHFVNAELSPAVKTQGAIVSHVLTEIDIACLPKDLPEFIEIDLSQLDTGHSLHVSGVRLPPGVTAVRHRRIGDPVVATAVVPKAVVETEEVAAAEGEVAAGATPAAPTADAKATDAKTADTKAAEAKPSDAKAAEKGGEKKDSGKGRK
ncbi:MAG: 50S ribosomal protein L25/general stress protein Ctc, partial [Casimicrobiaceae bacterium]